MRPYRPKTSAKIRIRIIPTNRRGCWAVPRTPASPTIPMAKPAARPLKPTARPAPRWMKPLQKTKVPFSKLTTKMFRWARRERIFQNTRNLGGSRLWLQKVSIIFTGPPKWWLIQNKMDELTYEQMTAGYWYLMEAFPNTNLATGWPWLTA